MKKFRIVELVNGNYLVQIKYGLFDSWQDLTFETSHEKAQAYLDERIRREIEIKQEEQGKEMRKVIREVSM